MKRMTAIVRRIVAGVMACGMVLALMPSLAMADSARMVTMGADLTTEQRAEVLKFFGLTESDLSKMVVVNVTNADERAHLSSSIDSDIIGNQTYSCSYIQPTTSGGIFVQTANLTYVTNNMLYNALQTAGVKNCNLVVTAPFRVSGTGALTGVFMAYESKGQPLDDAKESVATEELVATAQLSEQYGEGVAEVVSESKKQVVSNNSNLSNDQIRDIIKTVAASKGITLQDEDLNKLVDLIAKLQQLDYDADTFNETVSSFQSKIKEIADEAQKKGGFLDSVGDFFKKIGDFFAGLFNGGNRPNVDEAKKSAEEFFKDFNTDVFAFDKTGSSATK